MEDIYDTSGYGWDDEDKRVELDEKAQGSRFLVVRETGWNNPIAFVNFRFSVLGDFMDCQQGDKAIIILDIHVEEEFQRRGLAKHLMILLELIARREKMQHVALSIYIGDEIAKSWLEKSTKGYCIDPSLEQTIGFVPEMEGFDIYSKKLEVIKPTVSARVVAKKEVKKAIVAEKPIEPVVENSDIKVDTVLTNLNKLALDTVKSSETDDDWELVNPPTPTKDK
jgi:ribosomal protein S18 acetylase RimI-like enzyme